MLPIDRRRLIASGAAGLAFAGLSRHAAADTYRNEAVGYGPLVRDPAGRIDLPEGFSYAIISEAGQGMADGLIVPGRQDGMGAFSLGGSRVALVCNHEVKTDDDRRGPGGRDGRLNDRIDPARVYDTARDGRPLGGGTTTLIYDTAERRLVEQRLSLVGTSTNCCGGITPWGSWLSCEETQDTPETADVRKTHGWVFEVPATATAPVEPVALTGLGRFDHEAVCVDPRTGIVYLTEDQGDGLFYRFIPERPGELARGGRLQAMAFRDQPGADSSNHGDRVWSVGDWRDVRWIDLEETHSPSGDLRRRGHASGAVRVARGEGIHWGHGELYLAATSGGPIERGQILRYVPSPEEGRPDEARAPGRVELFVESTDELTLNMGDNLTAAPWGHLVVCEDNYTVTTRNHLRGVTPGGRLYALARNVQRENGEFAGACFSPDGSTLFVNIQSPGQTLAITGPWSSVRS